MMADVVVHSQNETMWYIPVIHRARHLVPREVVDKTLALLEMC